MKLIRLVMVLTLIIWPVSFLLNNTQEVFFSHFSASVLVGVSLFLYHKKNELYLTPVLLIPFIDIKLLPLPILVSVLSLTFEKTSKKTNLVILLISICIFAIQFKSFFGQTIFVSDYQARQEVIRNTHLYPNIVLARTFQNKAIIVVNKFYANFFSLIDINNYFFGFAPRQLIENQNLIKFPFAAFIFFLLGIFNFPKNEKYLKIITASLVISVAVLTNFDLSDIALWIPITLIIYFGILQLSKYKFVNLFFVGYIFFACLDLLRLFYI